MENAVSLEVPNKVDYESGKTWGDIYGLIMAYLNANIPVEYAQIRKRISYMILKVIMAKLKTVLFSALVQSLVNRFCSMQLWKTVRSFIDSQLQRLFNVV